MTEDEAVADDEVSSEDKKKMDTKTPEGSKVMLEGDHGQIYGVSRPVVFGIGITLFIVLASAFIFASSGSQKLQKSTSCSANRILPKRINAAVTSFLMITESCTGRMRKCGAPKPPKHNPKSGNRLNLWKPHN